MKTIIIHHIEETWEKTFNKLHKDSLDEFAYELFDYLEANRFDKIIMTQFEYRERDKFYQMLSSTFYVQLEEYSYGWDETDSYNEWIDGGNHSRFLLVPDFLEQIKESEITICGIFDGECLEDLEVLLGTFDIKYTRLEQFIR